MDNIKIYIDQLNSFDYIFIIFALYHMYYGFTKGFRLMAFETLKWFVLVAGLYLSKTLLYPYLLEQEKFLHYSLRKNDWFLKSAMSLIKNDDPIKNLLYTKIAESIPYDQLVFYLACIALISLITRLLILGTSCGREGRGRALGLVFGFVKALVITYIVMGMLAGFMLKSNPTGFTRWQENSYILSAIGYKWQ